MKKINTILIILTSILFWNCISNQRTNTKTTFEYDTIQNGLVNIQKTESVYNSANNQLIERKFYRNNPSNDNFIKLISGVTDKDGITLYSIDSLFYAINGFDSIRTTYKKSNSIWIKNMIESKKYNESDKFTYLRIELPEKNGLVEEFKKYNKNGTLSSNTRYECNFRKKGCDSIFKESFIYDNKGKLKHSIEQTWKGNKWESIECF